MSTRESKNKHHSPLLHLRDSVSWVLENSRSSIKAFQGIFRKAEKLTL